MHDVGSQVVPFTSSVGQNNLVEIGEYWRGDSGGDVYLVGIIGDGGWRVSGLVLIELQLKWIF